jgi:hypothetical protein
MSSWRVGFELDPPAVEGSIGSADLMRPSAFNIASFEITPVADRDFARSK